MSLMEEKIMKETRTLLEGTTEARDNFHSRPSDVIISTPMKSGTAWLQQIVHQLRTGGDEAFEDIELVVPRIPPGTAKVYGDLNAEQTSGPRCYSAHDSYDAIPKPGRYIVVVRDPVDTCYSAYNYGSQVWGVPLADMDPQVYWEKFYKSDIRSIFAILPSWWPHRRDSNVLFLHYEDLKADLRKCVVKIAQFMQMQLTRELEDVVVHRSTFEYMKKHGQKFDGSGMIAVRMRDAGIPFERGRLSRIRDGGGTVGQDQPTFAECLVRQIEQEWKAKLAPITGYQTYEEMRENESLLLENVEWS